VSSASTIGGSSARYSVNGSLGQPIIGQSDASSYTCELGFWPTVDHPFDCCLDTRGNVNNDPEDLADISDLVYLINYLFMGGDEPACFYEADVAVDGLVDISDLVYLIAYIMIDGIPLPNCEAVIPTLRTNASEAVVELSQRQASDGSYELVLATDNVLKGLHIRAEVPDDAAEISAVDEQFEYVIGQSDGITNIGFFDRSGRAVLPAGETVLLRSDQPLPIVSASATDADFHTVVCRIGEGILDRPLPTDYSLAQNYPNPFNPITRIEFALPEAGQASIEVYNIAGQKVATIADGAFDAGRHTVDWNASDLASGIYFYRLNTDHFSTTRKMVLLK